MYAARESDLRFLFKPLDRCEEGGCHIRIWLPSEPINDGIDVVLMFHGGAFGFGQDIDVPVREVDYLLSKRVVVASAQYRLGPHALFPDIIDDLCDAYAWVWTELVGHVPGAKGIRGVALEGWSAGAASSCMAAAYCAKRRLPQPSAVLLHYGWLDLNQSIISSNKPTSPYEIKDLLAEPVCVGIPHGRGNSEPPSLREAWLRDMMGRNMLPISLCPSGTTGPVPAELNPIDLVTSAFPSTFVLVATKDDLIPAKQSYDFIQRLQKHNVSHVVGEADMVHGRSEITPEDERVDYDRWWTDAIRPGLDFVIDRLAQGVNR